MRVDMSSSNPADQRVWGPHAWHFLHSVAETYDPSKRESLLAFVRALPDLLPCSVCGDHLREHLASMDVEGAAGSARGVSDFMWELHNRVNADIGKPRWPVDASRVPDLRCTAERAARRPGMFQAALGSLPTTYQGRVVLIILALLAIGLLVALLRGSRQDNAKATL